MLPIQTQARDRFCGGRSSWLVMIADIGPVSGTASAS